MHNRLHGLSADFRRHGVVVNAGAGRLALNLQRIGYGGRLAPVAPAQPEATGTASSTAAARSRSGT